MGLFSKKEKMSQQQLDEKLIYASRTGNLKEVKRLINLGANVNYIEYEAANKTPLFFALDEGNAHLDVAEYLIESGADVNYKKKDGISILDFAQHFNYTKIIELIKKKMEDK